MGMLRIQLFGSVRVSWGGAASDIAMSRPAYALLSHLAITRHRRHSRESLAGLFWADHSGDRARACLNTTLWRLRRAIEPPGTPRGTYLGTTPTGELYFNADSDHWLDVEVLEDRLTRFLREPGSADGQGDTAAIEHVLQLYTGDLMEAYFDDWVLAERERLRNLLMKALTRLMHRHREEGAIEESLACAQRILLRDPLREDIHQAVMRIHLDGGQRALAATQYARCAEALESLLGVPPMDETRRLYAQAVEGCADRGGSSTSPDLTALLARLESAISRLRGAGDDLDAVARAVRGFTDTRPSGRPGRLAGVIRTAEDQPAGKTLAR